MPKLAIVATIEITQGRIDDYLTAAVAHRARCLAGEPGTLSFEIMRPRDDDAKVILYEIYAEDAAFETHRNGASEQQARAELEAAGIAMNIVAVRCTPVE